MRSPDRLLASIAILLLVLLAAGLRELFQWREESGDNHPPYSTLRADPLGAKAVYEALGETPSLDVQRNFRPVRELSGQPATIFYLGAGASWLNSLNDSEFRELSKLVEAGHRLVITLRSITGRPMTPPGVHSRQPLISSTWGAKLAYREPDKEEQEESIGLGNVARWTLAYFEPTPDWNVRVHRQGHATIIERTWGKGSIVLAADSFALSNEAQWKERDAALLAWMAGPNQRLLFDESHLGSVESGSIAGLIRRYRLQGFVAVLLLLTLLFVWQSASPFLPPSAEAANSVGVIRGESAEAGFVRLLRRSIPKKQLMAACWQMWERSSRLLPRHSAKAVERAAGAARNSGGALESYSAVRRTLAERE